MRFASQIEFTGIKAANCSARFPHYLLTSCLFAPPFDLPFMEITSCTNHTRCLALPATAVLLLHCTLHIKPRACEASSAIDPKISRLCLKPRDRWPSSFMCS